MARFFLMLLLLSAASCCSVRAQKKDNSIRIFIEPLALGDFVNRPSLRAGIQVPITPAFSFVATGGTYLNGGYIGKAELKYSCNISDIFDYVSIEYGFIDHGYFVRDNISVYDSAKGHDEPGAAYSYGIHKSVNYGNVKIGQVTDYRHFYFEYYLGAGLRSKSTNASVTPAEQEKLYHYTESMIEHVSSFAGCGLLPNVSLGIRLGWKYY